MQTLKLKASEINMWTHAVNIRLSHGATSTEAMEDADALILGLRDRKSAD